MSRNDYKLIAHLLHEMREAILTVGADTFVPLRELENGLAKMMKRDNPRFDKKLFFSATGRQ